MTIQHGSYVTIPSRPLTEEEFGWAHEIMSYNPTWADADLGNTRVIAKCICGCRSVAFVKRVVYSTLKNMASLRGLEARLTVYWEKLTGRLVRRQPEALSFATHIAVLAGLARMNKIENVLELGCGRFSTLTFTNPDAFPHLKNLRTVENNPQWAKQVREYVAADSRVEFVEYEGQICNAIREMNLGQFDLIFIDDSMDADQRASTIVQVSQKPGGAIVVMHDFENIIYRRASKRFENVYRFTALNPNTGVAWAGNRLERRLLRHMNKAIRQSGTAPNDIAGWVRLFSSFPAASH